MSHILSYELRQEFLSAPGLARLTLAYGGVPQEPTLLLKCPTLTIKYCVSSVRLELILLKLNQGRLAYGVRVHDDPDYPSTHWSILEKETEKEALEGLLNGEVFPLFLFNELTVNVAWVSCCLVREEEVSIDVLNIGGVVQDDYADEVSNKLRCLEAERFGSDDGYVFEILLKEEWHSVESHYVTNRLTNSMVSVFSSDEGGQQEEVALWLIDGLCLNGALKGPEVEEEGGGRELCDLLISYEYGSFLFESKALSIFDRDSLPDRKKLAKATKKHIRKAVRQLVGGVKNLRRGLKITDSYGVEVSVNVTHLPHLIILVPDLSLLTGAYDLGRDFLIEIMGETDGFFHILDPMTLFRHVQAAHMLSDASESGATTPLMAFDHWLIERSKVAIEQEDPCFDILVRMEV
ncbi:hypothetical protein AAG584_04185 [Vreelandella titanicae]|uniref:hypothetical protein n=1 Tax=Vreelandella titanicae TaxID=664683 RepID=UPI003159F41F